MKLFITWIILFFSSFECLTASWSSLATLNSKDSTNPSLIVDSGGKAVCVWQTKDTILSATCPFSGSWTPSIVLSNPANKAKNPSVFIDNNDNIFAFWLENSGEDKVVRYSTFPKNGKSWSNAKTFTKSHQLYTPDLFFNSYGNGLAIWFEKSKGNKNFFLKSARYSGSDQSWSILESIELSEAINYSPNVGFDKNRNAVMTWIEYTDTSETEWNLLSATLSAISQSWSAPIRILHGFGPLLQCTVVDKDGNATLVYNGSSSAGVSVKALRLPFGSQTWQEANFPTSSCFGELSAAIDAKGNVLVVWIDPHSNGVNFSSLPYNTSTWTQPEALLPKIKHQTSDLALQVDCKGNALVMWSNLNTNVLQTSQREYGKRWTSPETIASFFRHNMFPEWAGWPQLGLSSKNGSAVVVIPQWINSSQDGIQAVSNSNVFPKAKVKK